MRAILSRFPFSFRREVEAQLTTCLLACAVTSSNRLKPLYSDRHIPSSLKSLSWSWPPDPQQPHLLFACGTRELLCAFSVAKEGKSGVLVRPKGTVLGEEGGEVRAMDFAVLRLPQHDGEKAKHVLAVGYSDGTLQVRSYSPTV